MSSQTQRLLSKTILRVDAASPLSENLPTIRKHRASHVAVFARERCLGVSSMNATKPPADSSTFADVVEGDSCITVADSASVEEFGRHFQDSNIEALLVNNSNGEFVGVVTRQSLLEAMLSERNSPPHADADYDATKHRRAESLLAGEKRILEIISAASSQDGGLTELAEFVESQSDGAICSILIMDESGSRLKNAASDGLPDALVEVIDGIQIGPQAGACGTAAYLNRTIIVSDISSDPLCVGVRDLALSHGLRACWSKPIRSPSGKVLGTIAMYFNQPRSPDANHKALIDRAIHLAAIAIERKRSEDALTRSEQKLRRAQQIAHVGSFELAADGTPAFWSDECFRILGIEPGSAIPSRKHYLEQFVHPDDREMSMHTVGKATNYRQRYEYEYRVVRPDASVRWVHIRGEPVCDAAGELVSIDGVMLDITERKQTEESLRASETTSRTLLEGSPVCTKIIDLDFRLRYMSAAGQNQLKIDDIEPFYGSSFPPDLYPESWRAPVRKLLQRAKKGETCSIECPVRDTDGIPVWYDTTFVPARDVDGQVQYIIVTSVNVTARRQAEEEARVHRDELAHVSRVSTMGELATGIGHELNQPLSAITAYSFAARRMADGIPSAPDEFRGMLDKLDDQAFRASEIVRRLRDFVRKTDSERTRAELNTLVQDVAAFIEPDVRQANVRLTLKLDESSPVLNVDTIQIQQVLVNLIRNAIDAMAETPIDQREVTVSTHVLPDGHSEVMVIDAGKGLGTHGGERIFDAFYSTRQGGMGMGLPISRSIVEAHGGKLSAKANVDRGTTFRFTIPQESTSEPDINPTVFIVDDEPVMRDSLSLVVQAPGIAVRCCASGTEFLEALEAYDESQPICLIADVQMRNMSGLELLEKLNRLNRHLPTVLMTGHGTPALKQRAQELGATALLEKPFHPAEVQEFIAVALRQSSNL